MPKSKDRTEESKNGELGLIIDEFGRAMWNANREYMVSHEQAIRPSFTPSMYAAWHKYIDFCMRYPK